jgi:hypothetical protein
MVGYITAGTLQVGSRLRRSREGCEVAAHTAASRASSPFNPYVEVLEALKKFDSSGPMRTRCC